MQVGQKIFTRPPWSIFILLFKTRPIPFLDRYALRQYNELFSIYTSYQNMLTKLYNRASNPEYLIFPTIRQQQRTWVLMAIIHFASIHNNIDANNIVLLSDWRVLRNKRLFKHLLFKLCYRHFSTLFKFSCATSSGTKENITYTTRMLS